MKTSEALALANAIGALQASTHKASAMFGFGLALNQKALAPVVESFETARKALAEQFAEKDESGAAVVVDAGGGRKTYKFADEAAFAAEFAKLVDVEVAPAVHKIALDLFPKEIEPAFVGALMPIIEAPAA